MQRIMVVFPAPFGPKNPSSSPGNNCSEIPFSASRPRYFLRTFVSVRIGVGVSVMMWQFHNFADAIERFSPVASAAVRSTESGGTA